MQHLDPGAAWGQQALPGLALMLRTAGGHSSNSSGRTGTPRASTPPLANPPCRNPSSKSMLHIPSQFQLPALHHPTPSRTARISLSLSLSSHPFHLSSCTCLPLPPSHLSPSVLFLLKEITFWCQGQNCLCCSGHWSCSKVPLLLSIFYFMNFPFPLLLDSFKG